MQLTIRQPDDFHLHLRDGEMMKRVLPESARVFGRALVMPNLSPPVLTRADAMAYESRIREALPKDTKFIPLMTLYLTESTDPKDVALAIDGAEIASLKMYPYGATTNSEYGVSNFCNIDPVLDVLVQTDTPLCIHGELAGKDVDIFDREQLFIKRILPPIRERFPELRIVLEHITTCEAVEYVRSNRINTAATITVHHLAVNRNSMFRNGIRPHYYCLPVAKREEHRQSLLAAATGGDSCFFLGTDSAPHGRAAKESHCGCAGIFTAPVAMQVLAQLFEEVHALDMLERFTSASGAQFYGLDQNERHLTLTKCSDHQPQPSSIRTNSDEIIVFDPGFGLNWRIEGAIK